MAVLNLDLFTSAAYDLERAQYRVLSGLQAVRSAFSQNQIYPHLGELVKLYGTLRTIAKRTDDFKGSLPGRIKRVDLENSKIEYEWPELDRGELTRVRGLIEWALPRIQDAIEEGRTIYEFVDENLRLEEVGLLSSYVQEGYLLVPDRAAKALHVLQYSLSIYAGTKEQYRSLKTTHLQSIPYASEEPSPHDVKLRLVAEHRDLPNPATYFFDTDLAFPYEPTVFPIAKRKLMRHLYENGGAQA